METLKTTINYAINYNVLQETFNKIDAFVKANDYQFKDRKGLDNITESTFNEVYRLLSKKRKKRLAKSIWLVEVNPSLNSINRFLHFLLTKVMKSDLRVRIIKSEKELAIEQKRKAYKEALAKVKAAYVEYKTEKGDFYKKNLVNKQAI